MQFWIIIAGLVLLSYIFLKFKDIRHRIGLVFMILFLLFIVLSFKHVQTQSDMDLKSPSGWIGASKMYVTWLKGLGGNVADITGQVIHKDWSVNSVVGEDETEKQSEAGEPDEILIESNSTTGETEGQ